MQVVRGGRRVEVSIFDLVVGDVVPLKIGDQVYLQVLLFELVVHIPFKLIYLVTCFWNCCRFLLTEF